MNYSVSTNFRLPLIELSAREGYVFWTQIEEKGGGGEGGRLRRGGEENAASVLVGTPRKEDVCRTSHEMLKARGGGKLFTRGHAVALPLGTIYLLPIDLVNCLTLHDLTSPTSVSSMTYPTSVTTLTSPTSLTSLTFPTELISRPLQRH